MDRAKRELRGRDLVCCRAPKPCHADVLLEIANNQEAFMPHYSDGTAATRGDIVRGKGYNIKDKEGELAEIVGVLIGVTANASVCNVSVLVPDGELAGTVSSVDEGGRIRQGAILGGRIEYGQADHFELIARPLET